MDGNAKAITDALRRTGVSILDLTRIGGGCPDLLAGLCGENFLFEIKNPASRYGRGKQKTSTTELQKKFRSTWNGQLRVVSSASEALDAIGMSTHGPRTQVNNYEPIPLLVASTEGKRSPEALAAVVEQFRHYLLGADALFAPRTEGAAFLTFCNLFSWGFTRAMGCEVPHWVDKDGRPASSALPDAFELNANATIRWLDTTGRKAGWRTATRDNALASAARGEAVLLTWPNPKGHGHIAVMLPSGLTAQAGSRNFIGGTVATGFGALPVTYWRHA